MVKRTAKRAAVTVCLALVVIGLAGRPAGADDAFARITGPNLGLIQGDQTAIPGVPASMDGIQVFDTGFGLNVPAPPFSPPVAAPFTFSKRFDRASPKLLLAAFTGEPLDVEIIWFMNLPGTGAGKQTFSIKLAGAFITSIGASAQLQGNDGVGGEQVALTFSKITFIAPNVDSKGQVGAPIAVCLDVTTGKKC